MEVPGFGGTRRCVLGAFQMKKTPREWMGSCTESPQQGLTGATVQCCHTALFWRE